MLDKKDYPSLTLDELLAEEKKIKRNQNITAGLIGFLVGVIIYSVINKSISIISLGIPLLLISAIARNSNIQKNNLKRIRSRIEVVQTK